MRAVRCDRMQGVLHTAGDPGTAARVCPRAVHVNPWAMCADTAVAVAVYEGGRQSWTCRRGYVPPCMRAGSLVNVVLWKGPRC